MSSIRMLKRELESIKTAHSDGTPLNKLKPAVARLYRKLYMVGGDNENNNNDGLVLCGDKCSNQNMHMTTNGTLILHDIYKQIETLHIMITEGIKNCFEGDEKKIENLTKRNLTFFNMETIENEKTQRFFDYLYMTAHVIHFLHRVGVIQLLGAENINNCFDFANKLIQTDSDGMVTISEHGEDMLNHLFGDGKKSVLCAGCDKKYTKGKINILDQLMSVQTVTDSKRVPFGWCLMARYEKEIPLRMLLFCVKDMLKIFANDNLEHLQHDYIALMMNCLAPEVRSFKDIPEFFQFIQDFYPQYVPYFRKKSLYRKSTYSLYNKEINQDFPYFEISANYFGDQKQYFAIGDKSISPNNSVKRRQNKLNAAKKKNEAKNVSKNKKRMKARAAAAERRRAAAAKRKAA